MSILDKLIWLGLEDVTETAWWSETVFRELSQTDSSSPEVTPDPESAELSPEAP